MKYEKSKLDDSIDKNLGYKEGSKEDLKADREARKEKKEGKSSKEIKKEVASKMKFSRHDLKDMDRASSAMADVMKKNPKEFSRGV